MARSKKKGLDYYYKSVHDMDDFRVMELMERYGPVGYTVLDITMSCVYRNGYYLEMPIKRLAMCIYRYIARTCDQNCGDVEEIIRYCGEIGIFDSELLARSVITSTEIQEHYSFVAARRKADKSKYWLLPEPEPETVARKIPSATETPVNDATEGIHATDAQIIEPVANSCEREAGINDADCGINDADCGINGAIIPQRKENKSKENKTKQNESKANESKAKQTRRASADELFPIPEFVLNHEEPAAAAEHTYEYDDGYAFASPVEEDDPQRACAAAAADHAYEYDDGYAFACRKERMEPYDHSAAAAAGREYEYAEKYTGRDAYSDIESAYISVSGKKLTGTDKAFICAIRDDGADDGMILQAIHKVASRKNREKINSFRYFVPMIREMLEDRENKADSGSQEKCLYDDGFTHNDTVYDDPYANCTTTEEYIAVLDNEINCQRTAF